MRGDWIHDWVRVEMEYRAGPRPAVAARERRPRLPSAKWKALRAAVFPARRPAAWEQHCPAA
jgi:hypothetical protein